VAVIQFRARQTKHRHSATLQWQREQWASLPDIPYKGIVLTMPKELWPIFQRNRRLLHDLPTLGADVIQQWAHDRHGARLIIVVVSHTFARNLDFNCHLHILVSAGGLQEKQNRWVPSLYYHRDSLMQRWRDALTRYLLQALTANVLQSELDPENLEELFRSQSRRWWNVRVQGSQTNFLGAAPGPVWCAGAQRNVRHYHPRRVCNRRSQSRHI
jgi:hypothetical protein